MAEKFTRMMLRPGQKGSNSIYYFRDSNSHSGSELITAKAVGKVGNRYSKYEVKLERKTLEFVAGKGTVLKVKDTKTYKNVDAKDLKALIKKIESKSLIRYPLRPRR